MMEHLFTVVASVDRVTLAPRAFVTMPFLAVSLVLVLLTYTTELTPGCSYKVDVISVGILPDLGQGTNVRGNGVASGVFGVPEFPRIPPQLQTQPQRPRLLPNPRRSSPSSSSTFLMHTQG